MQRRKTMDPTVERRYWKALGWLFGLSVVLALVCRSLPMSLATPIPVANFHDRLSGASANGVYFIGMYVAALSMLPVVVRTCRHMILPGLARGRRLLGFVIFLGPVLFGIHLCVLMPATTKLGTGRFSALLSAAVHWPIAFGLIYGVFFYVTVHFLGLAIASLAGRHVPADAS